MTEQSEDERRIDDLLAAEDEHRIAVTMRNASCSRAEAIELLAEGGHLTNPEAARERRTSTVTVELGPESMRRIEELVDRAEQIKDAAVEALGDDPTGPLREQFPIGSAVTVSTRFDGDGGGDAPGIVRGWGIMARAHDPGDTWVVVLVEARHLSGIRPFAPANVTPEPTR